MKKALMVLGLLVSACSMVHSPQTEREVGKGVLPLRTTSASGKEYKLRGMLEVTDDLTGLTETVDLDVPDPTITISLGPELNTLYLVDGWVLEDMETSEPVEARLMSDNPMSVSGIPGQTTYIPLRFAVGDSLLLFSTDPRFAEIGVEVTEGPAWGDLCAEGDACFSGMLVGSSMFNYEYREIPFAISFDVQGTSAGPSGVNVSGLVTQLRFDDSGIGAWNQPERDALSAFAAELQGSTMAVMLSGTGAYRTDLRLEAYGPTALFAVNAAMTSTSTYGYPQLEDATGVTMGYDLCTNVGCYEPAYEPFGQARMDVR